MTTTSLQDVLDAAPTPLRALRDLPFVDPIEIDGLVPEYTNWRREQTVWHKSAALMDQSHHMLDLWVTGPDAYEALGRLTAGSYTKFRNYSAKQYIAVSPEGYIIGDGILIRYSEDSFHLIGDMPLVSWVKFNLETGDADVTLDLDLSTPLRGGKPPRNFRYEIQGPDALKIIAKATVGELPDTKFFGLEDLEIAGHKLHGLRHGMAGQPGLELYGPWAAGDEVRAALLEAGAEYGIEEVGFRAYWTSCLESGWLCVELPATVASPSTRAYREWLPAEWATAFALGGSYDSENIEDYLISPFALGYGKFIEYDRDFVGKEALLAQKDETPRRTKVTLIWDDEDLGAVVRALVRPEDGLPPQGFHFHDAAFAQNQDDAIQIDGKTVGFAVQGAYLASHRRFVSLAVIDTEFATPGTEAVLVWGDSLTQPRKDVEEHRQFPIRVTVAPAPFDTFAREQYRK
ncbi:MAG TPA: aminomethyl transferase family protein [Pseudolysinimonas sp.]|nr:aminomethyl transferase family protein [Pseudolysinimonas sp.]